MRKILRFYYQKRMKFAFFVARYFGCNFANKFSVDLPDWFFDKK